MKNLKRSIAIRKGKFVKADPFAEEFEDLPDWEQIDVYTKFVIDAKAAQDNAARMEEIMSFVPARLFPDVAGNYIRDLDAVSEKFARSFAPEMGLDPEDEADYLIRRVTGYFEDSRYYEMQNVAEKREDVRHNPDGQDYYDRFEVVES